MDQFLSFRELLLKKTADNPYLSTLVEWSKDEVIADLVLESLRKMAEPSAALGRGANSAITTYAGSMDNSDIEQLRDALAHHISHYKSALKNDNKAVATQHLNQIVPLMHLAARAAKHSGGKAVFDYASTIPWETNYTRTDRITPEDVAKNGKGTVGKLVEGTKDLGRRPKRTTRTANRGNGVPDYGYLEMPPHPGHAYTENMPHKGGYPFEEIQFGSPAKKDAGKAYLPIEDVAAQEKYVPHAFDAHPVYKYADHKQDSLNNKMEQVANELAAWKSGPQHKAWLESHKEKFKADPEAYKARGLSKPGHVFEGIPLREPEEHHKSAIKVAPAVASPEAVASPAAAAPAKSKVDFNALPAHLRDKFKDKV